MKENGLKKFKEEKIKSPIDGTQNCYRVYTRRNSTRL